MIFAFHDHKKLDHEGKTTCNLWNVSMVEFPLTAGVTRPMRSHCNSGRGDITRYRLYKESHKPKQKGYCFPSREVEGGLTRLCFGYFSASTK